MENELYREYKLKKHANYFVLPSYTFDKACNNAYADMARHVLHIVEKPLGEKSVRETAKEEAKNFLKVQLRVVRFKSQNDFDKWHTGTCRELIKIYKKNECFDENEQPSFTYGHAQKWLNMLFKYLYVYEYSDEFKDFFRDKTKLIKYLHIPIDEKIFEEANKVFGLEKPNCGWSQMDENTYKDYQEGLIKNIIKNPNPPYGEEDGRIPFYWELMVWSKPKN